jgi:hypothetical protein
MWLYHENLLIVQPQAQEILLLLGVAEVALVGFLHHVYNFRRVAA